MTGSSSGSGDETLAGTLAPEVGRGAALAPGDRIGRYVLLRRVGRGAMGEVFAAYDPELDRRIALKLLAGDIEGGRTSAEARAMARLSHPNVVGIHDVSEVHGRPLIAMELVEGTTLAEWFETKPAVSEVVEAFVAAGRGLAAAHEAGIVHRDFKPANVLVEVDKGTGKLGRVRVGDFGLAQARTTRTPTSPAQRRGDVLVGTPRYMSPEQFGDSTVTARADQFSFCVALYEGVYGEGPFAGTTPAELARAVLEGDRRPVPERSDVPRRVRRVLERGLSKEPTDRFESMDALLAELDPPTRRRNWVLTAALIGLAGVAGLAAAPDPVPRGCEPSAVAAELPELRSRAKAALLSRGLAQETSIELDAIAERLETQYTKARRDACEAHEKGDIPDERLYAQLRCVDTSEAELRALLVLWTDADDDTVAIAKRALSTVEGGSCSRADGRRLDLEELDPASLQTLIESRATALVLQTSGKHREAVAYVDALEPEALPANKLVADLFRIRGVARIDLGDLDAGEADLWRSVGLATAVEAHTSAALAWIWLIQLEANDRGRPHVALRWEQIARAHAGNDPLLGALLKNHVGSAYFAAGEYSEAERAFRKALSLADENGLEITAHRATLENNLGSIHAMRGEFDEAEKRWRESLRLDQEDSKVPTVSMANPLLNLARAYTLQGDEDRAVPARQEALDYARELSKSSPAVASETAASLAGLLAFAGYYQQAHDAAAEGLALIRNGVEADAALVTTRQLQFARYWRTGNPDAKVNASLEDGMKAVDGGIDVDDFYVALALLEETQWQIDHGDLARAEVVIERAESVIKRANIVRSLARLHRARARLLAVSVGPEAALEYLQRPLPDPDSEDDAILHATRAELWRELGDTELAESAARAAVKQLSAGQSDRRTSCTVRATLVRATAPNPDPRDLAKAIEACDTDPPRPEAAFLQTVASAP